MSKPRPYLALDPGFMDDPDIVAAGEKAAWLYLAMALDARLHMTDGLVPKHRLDRLGVNGWKPRLSTLMSVGLVVETVDGYLLPGYLKWNPSQREYEQRRHEGRIGVCKRHHAQPCTQERCRQSRQWMDVHTGSPPSR